MEKLKTKKVFSFHPETKEFIGETIADESPLEKGKGIFLLPANSTEKTPPSEQKDGFYIFWDGADWQYKKIEIEKPTKTLPTREELAADIRRERNYLLSQSDWTQIADSPVKNVKEWQDYRFALRNITKQNGFPEKIVWPTAPNN